MTMVELIQNVGFPIFAFLVAGFGCKYVYDKETSRSDKQNEQMEKLTEAVNHNSESILRLCDKVGDIDDRQ